MHGGEAKLLLDRRFGRVVTRNGTHGQLPDFDSNLFVAVCFYETLLAGLVGSYVLCSLRSYPDTCIISNS